MNVNKNKKKYVFELRFDFELRIDFELILMFSMGLCLCKHKSKRRHSSTNYFNNNNINNDNTNGTTTNASRSRFFTHSNGRQSINDISDNCSAQTNQTIRSNDMTIVTNSGTNYSKLSSMVDKLVLETLALIRTLVDK
jgi:hypothetical protein